MVLALALVAASCGGDADEDVAAVTTTIAPVPATTATVPTTVGGTTVAATPLTLRITDIRLLNSEESDNAVRILLPAGVASASVTVAGLPSPNRVISVCQADDLDRRLTTAACRMPASGEAVNVALGSAAKGVEIVQAGVSSSGPEGNTTTLGEVTIRYTASSRDVSVRLSQIAGGDSGAKPTFALTPTGTTGAYQARLTWTVIQVFGGTPSSALVELVQGGNVANKAEGGGLNVQLNGTLSPPGEATIRVQNAGSSALVAPKLALTLP